MDTTQQPTTFALTDSYTPLIEQALQEYCQHKITKAHELGDGVAQLWSEIGEYITGGGKRLRPRIFLLIHDFYSNGRSAPLAAACAWELLHASLLIHDDIIDRDTIRHSKLNVAGKYHESYSRLTTTDAGHYALSAALLAGDLLLSSAYGIIIDSPLTDAQKIRMQQYLQKAIFTVGGGELLDTESALYPIDSVDPFAIAVHKTSSYSFQMPLESGAALAGAPDEEIRKLGEIGRYTGTAFQLQDDLLGIFGDSAKTGKSNRSDILEKKRTLLVQHTYKNATAPNASHLKTLYSLQRSLTEEEAEEVYEIITKTGAKDHINTLIEENIQAALAVVDSLAIHPSNRALLAKLISGLVGRQA